MESLCWYVAYGSNLSYERVLCYLQGGRPPGARRTYAAVADPSPPRDDRATWLDGALYFALESEVWGGGIAFLDQEAPARTPARGYLISTEQRDAVFAAETRYGELFSLPAVDGIPACTFGSTERIAPRSAPSPAYLETMARGLTESHGWSAGRAAEYLSGLTDNGQR
ncbi:MAG: hypothetical protein GEU93_05510 [Propionibacteriales bacterium]|nr:hypothetical protein [Propionibacteriales bacterium]